MSAASARLPCCISRLACSILGLACWGLAGFGAGLAAFAWVFGGFFVAGFVAAGGGAASGNSALAEGIAVLSVNIGSGVAASSGSRVHPPSSNNPANSPA
ncbi:MAG: hypothetical protein R3E95_01280 [Thiolinea sp.]